MTGSTNEDRRAARERANRLRYAVEEYQARMRGWKHLNAGVFRFWTRKQDWPSRNPGYVFLGEAVHKLGKAYFLDAWTGIEPMVTTPPEPPNAEVAAVIARSEGFARILEADSEPPQRQDKNEGMRLGDADLVAATKRFTFIKLFIANLAASGGLLTSTRAIAGGEVRPMPASFWSTEQIDQRFQYCQMKPTDPFTTGVAGAGFEYIFVGSESLNAVLVGVDLSHQKARGEPAPEPQQPQSATSGRPSPIDIITTAARELLERAKAGSFDIPATKRDFAKAALAEAEKSPAGMRWMEEKPAKWGELRLMTPKSVSDHDDFDLIWKSIKR